MDNTRALILMVLAAGVCACGRVREYDYDDLLEGRPAVLERGSISYCYQDPPGMTEDEADAHRAAFEWHGTPLPEELEIHGYRKTKVELTGAVDRAGKAEITFHFEFLQAEVSEVELFIDGARVDTATRAGGDFTDIGNGFGRTTLVGWTPPPRTNYIPWQESPRMPEWRLAWSGPDDHWGSRSYLKDPFSEENLGSD